MTLGVLLHRRNIPFTIFELRHRPTDGELDKPSGMLDLQEESGLAAIRECGLYDLFLQLTGECAESLIVTDKDGNSLHADEGVVSNRPEIARHALTKLLASQLPPQSVKYEHKLLSAVAINTTRPHGVGTSTDIELDFGPHGKKTFDFVVGADGAWSRVRNLLTDVKPFYAGTQCITTTLTHVTTKYPHLSTLIGPGGFCALGLHHGVMSHRGPHDSARVYTFLSTPDADFPRTSGLASCTAKAAKDRLLTDDALLGRFGPRIKDLVATACDGDSASSNNDVLLDIKPLYKLPSGMFWPHSSNAILIGDAAHLMCPWAGEGVNLAMWDALSLSRAIIRAYYPTTYDAAQVINENKNSMSLLSALDSLTGEFLVEMVRRAKEKADQTQRNGLMMFGENGARDLARFFQQVYG
jgi:2-polyprenyl-6-methoxyphenol hydroxylase-like FAD-dependent oxidoreductase